MTSAAIDPAAGLSEGYSPHFPAPSRVYDYLLGGTDNFQPDRDVAGRIGKLIPNLASLARSNWAYMTAAVTHAGLAGIRQFIDLGCGMPHTPGTHQTALSMHRDARVVYVDADPAVAARVRSWSHPAVGCVNADLRDVTAVLLTATEGLCLIDPSRPVCLLACASLHWCGDDIAPVVAAYRRWLSSGSWLVITHAVSDDISPVTLGEIRKALRDTPGTLTPRPAKDVFGLFAGLKFHGRPVIMGGGYPAGYAIAGGIGVKLLPAKCRCPDLPSASWMTG